MSTLPSIVCFKLKHIHFGQLPNLFDGIPYLGIESKTVE